MEKVVFKVYWTQESLVKSKDEEQLTKALELMSELRKVGMTFVTMVSENSNQVGKNGVSYVSDGKLPNGDDYTYTKKDALSQRKKVYGNNSDQIEVPLGDE